MLFNELKIARDMHRQLIILLLTLLLLFLSTIGCKSKPEKKDQQQIRVPSKSGAIYFDYDSIYYYSASINEMLAIILKNSTSIIKKILLILVLTATNLLVAQNYSEKTLEKLYLKAIENRFDLMLQNSEIYFEPTTMINKVKSKVKVPNFKFLSQKKLEKKAFTENRPFRIISMGYNQNSKDTIDVYFPVVSLTVEQEGKIKKARYKLIPEKSNDLYIRLVYLKNDEWKIIHNGFVMN